MHQILLNIIVCRVVSNVWYNADFDQLCWPKCRMSTFLLCLISFKKDMFGLCTTVYIFLLGQNVCILLLYLSWSWLCRFLFLEEFKFHMYKHIMVYALILQSFWKGCYCDRSFLKGFELFCLWILYIFYDVYLSSN